MNTFACVSVYGEEFGNPLIRRVRHPFNDLRSYRVWAMLQASLVRKQKAVIQQLVDSSKQADQVYHFLSNPRVSQAELIKMNCSV